MTKLESLIPGDSISSNAVIIDANGTFHMFSSHRVSYTSMADTMARYILGCSRRVVYVCMLIATSKKCQIATRDKRTGG